MRAWFVRVSAAARAAVFGIARIFFISPCPSYRAQRLDRGDLDRAPGGNETREDAGHDQDREGKERAREGDLGIAEHLGLDSGEDPGHGLHDPDARDETEVA